MELDRCVGKKVLLVAPTINDLYKDIISQLKEWGMTVDFIEDIPSKYDPNYIRYEWHFIYDNRIGRSLFQNAQNNKWKELLSCSTYNKNYDYLLVINGLSLSDYLFDELHSRNPNIWAANYLFDSTRSLYRFQTNFESFNYVASFDKKDCKSYDLNFLPIYWCPQEEYYPNKYDLFGFGAYGDLRYELFKTIKTIAHDIGLSSYTKLYCSPINNFNKYKIKQKFRKAIGLKTYITPERYYSELITHSLMPSSEFRKFIYSSRITIDSVNFEQDGMTARFMWALGAQKKIITTNTNILTYDCYNPEQIFLVKDPKELEGSALFKNFLVSEYTPSIIQNVELLSWRLDNWLKTLLNI